MAVVGSGAEPREAGLGRRATGAGGLRSSWLLVGCYRLGLGARADAGAGTFEAAVNKPPYGATVCMCLELGRASLRRESHWQQVLPHQMMVLRAVVCGLVASVADMCDIVGTFSIKYKVTILAA